MEWVRLVDLGFDASVASIGSDLEASSYRSSHCAELQDTLYSNHGRR
jgi:hypothetical protein